MTNCGPGGSGTESCCTDPEVEGGTFYRTYPNGASPLGEADPATVSRFRLDKYLVTVGRFRQFASAWSAGWRPARGSGKHTHLNGGMGLVNAGDDAGIGYEPGWDPSDEGNVAPTDSELTSCAPFSTWTPSVSTANGENLPINCVSWAESYAFCIWDGGFLPSETEWEYAAAGGSQQLNYPWGTAVPGTDNQHAILGCNYPSGSEAGVCSGVVNIAPVGTPSLGAALWGQLDLAGDLLEWELDWYAPYRSPCIDCANLTPTSTRVDRGDDYYAGQSFLAPPYRLYGGIPPVPRGASIGLRCARAP
jgi:sulfatase modifying factor 1